MQLGFAPAAPDPKLFETKLASRPTQPAEMSGFGESLLYSAADFSLFTGRVLNSSCSAKPDNTMQDDFTDVQNSYGRCLRNTTFIERFYEILMDSHPDMRPAFARTDMGRQRHALRRGISNAILFGGGHDLVRGTVETVADLHSRKGRAPVPPNLYPYWMDSLIQAVSEHDPRFSPELETRWRQAIKPLIELFIERY